MLILTNITIWLSVSKSKFAMKLWFLGKKIQEVSLLAAVFVRESRLGDRKE